MVAIVSGVTAVTNAMGGFTPTLALAGMIHMVQVTEAATKQQGSCG